ncbi:FAD-dependent monooxygenase [Nocardia brasiliensis]|uniref:FAD-dependent monooxygenase n=1 Tax=Nocardia brasiliensis TaxID=37326 RepID=UPI003D8F4234
MLRSDALDTADPAFADLGPASHIFLVTQQNLESMLGDWAEDLGVQIRRGVTMTDFTDDGAGVTVRLGDTVVRADWLVGCDGGRSTVRKRAGFDFPGLDAEITGHQAIVEMTGAEELQPGWITTPTGMYTYGPIPGRILTVEMDGPPADRDAPITAAELQASLRAVSGVPVRITAVHSATRFTDNTRQVTSYRIGRVLLAGDAAHVHSPFGGQGLNLGIGDAVNLGWKLAAVVRGRADEELLDTYTAERHPIGAGVLDWTRAQIALMRLDQRSRKLRAFMTELLATRDGTTTVFKRISGVEHRYDLGGTHERVGAVAPDLELSDGTRLGEHFADGAAVLFDLADSAKLRALAANWSPTVRVVTAKPVAACALSGLLVRPDGYVVWAGEDGSLDGLFAAHDRWFGAA